MTEFNAQQAREIVESLNNKEVESVLLNIKKAAEQGETVLHVYNQLKSETISTLKERGFIVVVYLMSTIQKDGLYYSINW
jgi:hypothetical protein